jgi:hypothetical protein
MQTPTRPAGGSQPPQARLPLEQHALQCTIAACPECRFYNGFSGCLRAGSKNLFEPSMQHAWARKCAYKDVSGARQTWLTVSPCTNSFSVGCFVCNSVDKNTTFGRLEVQGHMLQVALLQRHATQKEHEDALKRLHATPCDQEGRVGDTVGNAADASEMASEEAAGIVSGISETVPRVDKFMAMLSVVLGHGSFSEYARQINSSQLGSALSTGAKDDSSRDTGAKLQRCMGEALVRRNFAVFSKAIKSSFALDERDSVLLVFARVLTGRGDLYECLVGLSIDGGSGAKNVSRALEAVWKEAFTVRHGRRCKSGHSGDGDVFEEQAWLNFRRTVRAGASDGGTSECRAIYECSKAAKDPARAADPLFPRLRYIFRDACHRLRSVQRKFWADLEADVKILFDLLVTGQNSFSKVLRRSRRFSLEFEAAQRAAKVAGLDVFTFEKIVRNLSYAEQRFDSRTEPLLRIFKLLPVIMDTLERCALMCDDDNDPGVFALIIENLTGKKGYSVIVRAAVASDILVISQETLRIVDKSDGDSAIVSSVAYELLDKLKCLLHDGAIWKPEANGTLTHAAIESIKHCKLYYAKKGVRKIAIVEWPSPEAVECSEPIDAGKRYYNRWVALVETYFPMHDEQTLFGAFDLDARLTMDDRVTFVRSLAERNGFNADEVAQTFVGGVGGQTGAFRRAQWHASPSGIVGEATVNQARHGAFREPDNKNLRAWLRTWRNLAKATSKSAEFVSILEDYLCIVPGTPVVERWLGQVAMHELKGRCHHLDSISLADATRLCQQDLSGRNLAHSNHPGRARELLIKTAATTTRSGGLVIYPATDFALHSQRVFAEFFGEIALQGRSLVPVTPQEIMAQEHARCKPQLGHLVKASSSAKTSVTKKHAGAVKDAILVLERSRKGESAATPSALQRMVQEQKNVAEERKELFPLQRENLSAQVRSGKRILPEDRAKEDDVRARKRLATLAAHPNQIPEFVGSRGDVWRAENESAQTHRGVVKEWKERTIFIASCSKVTANDWVGSTVPTRSEKKAHMANIVVVNRISAAWHSVDALNARLYGAWLVDDEWLGTKGKKGSRCVFSASVVQKRTFYLGDSFAAESLDYCKALEKASAFHLMNM